MRMKEEARLLGTVDVSGLRAYLESRGPDVWDFKCDAIRTLPHCTRIILRHSRDYNFDLEDVVDWPHMEHFRPYVAPIIEAASGMLGKNNVSAAFLANLPAGACIYPHIDRGDFLEIPSRVHVPIKTNSKVEYIIGGMILDEDYDESDHEARMKCQIMGKRFHMQEGEIWEIDNCSAHSVENYGPTDRWHLVLNLW